MTTSTLLPASPPPTYLPEVHHVSHLVMPGSESARQMTAISGQRCCALLTQADPLGALLKNVDGFTGMALDLVWSDLESANYEVGAVVFPASAVGAWHRRDRLWVIAHTQSVGCGSGRSWRSLASTSGKQQQTLSTRETPDGREYRVDQWTSEPSVDRMVPGLPSELDICRRRAIGNSIVPQQAFPVLRAIADSLRLERSA